jgi:hypothetical protein
MPWRCPACRAEIHHHPVDAGVPEPHVAYRCHRCRLDLRFDPITRQMEVAAFAADREVASFPKDGDSGR